MKIVSILLLSQLASAQLMGAPRRHLRHGRINLNRENASASAVTTEGDYFRHLEEDVSSMSMSMAQTFSGEIKRPSTPRSSKGTRKSHSTTTSTPKSSKGTSMSYSAKAASTKGSSMSYSTKAESIPTTKSVKGSMSYSTKGSMSYSTKAESIPTTKSVKGSMPYSNKGKPPRPNVICAKRLDIAFEEISALEPKGPFGLIETPSDVTDLCAFFPPDEGEPPNFGCPVLYTPDVGFVTGDEYEQVLSPPEAVSAYKSLVLYCDCYAGLELGCAAKIPHGPPTSSKVYEYLTSDGEEVTKEVIVPGFSEYIPASTPGERAEYCKMVGVWNGDFPPEVTDDLSDEVEMCGCYFIGQAQEMVDQCPGVDLGAFFQSPENATDTMAPTPSIPDATFYDSFESATFPEDPWSVSNMELMPAPIQKSGELTKALSQGIKGENYLLESLLDGLNKRKQRGQGRKLEEEDDDESNWTLMKETEDEQAYQGAYFIKSPTLSSEGSSIASVTLTIPDDAMLPAWFEFAYKTTCEDCTGREESDDVFFVYLDDELIGGVAIKNSDWLFGEIYIGPDVEEITIDYWYNFYESEDPKSGKVYLDEVYLLPSTKIPTYSPTITPSPN